MLNHRRYIAILICSTITVLGLLASSSLNSNWIPSAEVKHYSFPYSTEIDTESNVVLPLEPEAHVTSCRLPKLNPFDPSVQPYTTWEDGDTFEEPCDSGEYPLLFTTDLNSSKIIQVQDPSSLNYSSCCYRPFVRNKDDQEIRYFRQCSPIVGDETAVPDWIEFADVLCTVLDHNSSDMEAADEVLVDVLSFINLKKRTERRIEQWELSNNDEKFKRRRANVVILGIDAVSHMNFIRTMPRSYEFLKKNLTALGLDGYTKVGDNTFPNIVPVLLGQTVDEILGTCWNDTEYFDDCPLIWKEYAAHGYRTAYGEDAVWMAGFNYFKKGFYNSPTDYYYNALTYHAEDKLGHVDLGSPWKCQGPRMGFQVLLEFLQKMAVKMDRRRRYFQFIWATSLTHDYLNAGKLGDDALYATLQWFRDENYLQDTVFILMSDHGIRWGGIRSTLQGKIEERMPFLYFVFPEWFKEEYRSAVSNLRRNRARLTSHFDLHETLLDLLHLDNLTEENLTQRYHLLSSGITLPRGISLFLPIPLGRTCEDAGIADQWCVCQSGVPVNDTSIPIIQEAAANVVAHINQMFVNFQQCATLQLESILNAQILQTNNAEVEDSSLNITESSDEILKTQQFTCSVAIRLLPSNATFEATITRHTDGSWRVSGDISRTNLYGSQSQCVTDYNLKKFCYCL